MASPPVQITEMTIADYDEALALWRRTDGVGLDADVDSAEAIGAFLERNPGLSFVARAAGRLAGVVMCGTDGRRGYLHHLTVADAYRGRGLGRELVERVVAALGARKISKCHLFVFRDNTDGMAFWRALGWRDRTDDLAVMSRWVSED